MKLEEKRKRIDEIDARVLALLNQRTAVAREIAMLKTRAGLPIVDGERELDILRRLAFLNTGEIDDAAVSRIYEVILDESRRIQSSIRHDLLEQAAK